MKTRPTLWILLGVGVTLLILRLLLPSMLLHYVNQTLGRIPDYQASVGEIDVSLWRGAYVIRDLNMFKTGGQKKVPFLMVPKIDLSVEWSSLFQGKFVGEIHIFHPTVNFIQAKNKSEAQLTASESWVDEGKKLFPLQINRLIVDDGTATFQELELGPDVALHLTSLQAELTGITNVERKQEPLPVHLKIEAVIFDSGKLAVEGSAQLLHDPVGFDIHSTLEHVDLTQLNPYVRYHAGFNFKSGTFAMYASLQSHHGEVSGYVKPLFDHIAILNIKDAGNPLELAWEAVAATVVEVFTNHAQDRLATVIPVSGKIDDPHTNIWITVVNIVRNAFVQAFKPGFEKSPT